MILSPNAVMRQTTKYCWNHWYNYFFCSSVSVLFLFDTVLWMIFMLWVYIIEWWVIRCNFFYKLVSRFICSLTMILLKWDSSFSGLNWSKETCSCFLLINNVVKLLKLMLHHLLLSEYVFLPVSIFVALFVALGHSNC